jgi:hypothetical protein
MNECHGGVQIETAEGTLYITSAEDRFEYYCRDIQTNVEILAT